MKYLICKLLLLITLVTGASSHSTAEDMSSLIEDFQNGNLPINSSNVSILIPFAMEWDAQAASSASSSISIDPEHYRTIMRSDSNLLEKSIEALTANSQALEHFKKPEVQEAFDKVFEQARENGASVGMIPHNKALQYWLMSQILTVGPKTLSASLDNPSLQWCLPPFIGCTPKAPPEDK